MNIVRTNFDYSTKNIPIHNNKLYFKTIINKTEKFIRNLRWRSFFYLNPDIKGNEKETYGFRSTKPAPSVRELKEFEDELLKMIQNIKFCHVRDEFQNKLREDIDTIKKDEHLYIKADKTTNFYKVKPDEYYKLLDKNIHKEYKKETVNSKTDPTVEDKRIADSLEISDRIDVPAKNNAFITLKDHKPNFLNNPQCRLINPYKTEIGRISKQILERINAKIIKETKLNQWKNTNEVIQWYEAISNKQQKSAIVFDICNFYPSITEALLSKALNFAKQHIRITDEEKHIVMHSKNTSLIHKNETWCKKSGKFDVTMGSYDGAETCELVGLYLLSKLNHIDVNIGLYRDDGLAISNKTPRQTEIIKKEICQIFKNNGLSITIEANKKVVDYLDITLNLNTGTFKPFNKPNNTPLYVHSKSNHPPSIIKNIPISINKRLSNNSSNSDIFKDSTQQYTEALQKSGYRFNLTYTEEQTNNTKLKRQRTRNITWYNPPYSKNLKTKIGEKFLKLLDKCFPKDHILHKIINRSTVKISYSTLPNIQNIISGHNKTVLSKYEQSQAQQRDKTCNCKTHNTCPLHGQCLTQSVVYQATVTNNDTKIKETYTGLTECKFKTRYNLHQSSFKNKHKSKETALSEYIWSLKEKNIDYRTDWKIVSKAKPYSTSSKICKLCLEEKYYIIMKPNLASLNKRNELASTCRHRKKHLLTNYKPP